MRADRRSQFGHSLRISALVTQNLIVAGEILDTPGVANSIFNFPPSAKSSSSNPRQRCDRLRELEPERLRENEATVFRGVFDLLIAKLNETDRGSKRIK